MQPSGVLVVMQGLIVKGFWTTILICCCAAVARAQEAYDSSEFSATAASPDVSSGYSAVYSGSIIDELNDIAREKDSLFRAPTADRVFEHWDAFKDHFEDIVGLRFAVSYTVLYQQASDTLPGRIDHGLAGDLDIEGTWDWPSCCRHELHPLLGFRFIERSTLGAEISPESLSGEIGSLWPTAVGYFPRNLTVAELWFRHDSDDGRVRVKWGRIFPITQYDFFPLQNFRTDFVDLNHVTNLAIPLPDWGLGGFVEYRPQPNSYFRLGVHDANALVTRAGFDTLFGDGELFKIFEVGFDPGFMAPQPGRPPYGDVHLSIWHQDARTDAGIDEGWGIAAAAMQQFGRFLPFLRYGWVNSGATGPVSVQHMFNVGVAIDNIFGQDNDRIGVGYTWGKPADSSLGNQSNFDMYYRIQVTPRIEVSPIAQVILNPSRNIDSDAIFVGGIRARIAL